MHNLNALLRYVPLAWDPILCGSAVMAELGMRDVRDLDLLVPDEILACLASGLLPPGCRPRPVETDEPNPYPDARTLIRLTTDAGAIDVFSELPRVGPLYPDTAPRATRLVLGVPPPQPGGWQVLAPEIVMAIKCLVPRNHPKFARHMADVAALAAAHSRGQW